jgi:hypothetical protein
MFSRLCILFIPLVFSGRTHAADDPVRVDAQRVPATMSSRLSSASRAAAMAKFGGKDQAERSVVRGLRWLKQHQNEDGSWAPENRPAMTGFAMLCFLGHGEHPDSPEFGPTVKKGIDWLYTKGTEFDGRLSMTHDGWGNNAGVYEHAIATYALAEYYAMTREERIAGLLKQAVTHIVQGQDMNGGWQYHYEKGPRSDTSVSGWQIQALKAAYLTGLGIPGVEEALDKSMLNLKRVQAENGSFGYTNAGDRDFSLDGVGALCIYSWRQGKDFWKQDKGFWKRDKDLSVRDGIEHMLNMTEKKPVKYKGDSADLHAWYYDTQACLMFGGSAWDKWNRLFQDQIWNNQSPDGSWPPVNSKAPGSELQKKSDGSGPFYRTSLCTLMLEVFYRYAPR